MRGYHERSGFLCGRRTTPVHQRHLSYTFTETTDGDHFYYTGATAITQVWAASHGCDISTPAATVDVGVDDFDCRSYCPSEGALPQVLNCRAEMGHTYDYGTTLPLVLDLFVVHR
jgi:hypothetical protein